MHSLVAALNSPYIGCGSRSPASGYQVKDQNDQGYNEQNMDQSSGNVKGETEKPQDENDDEYCPEHFQSFLLGGAPGTRFRPGAHASYS
jgi:hypothetical protein